MDSVTGWTVQGPSGPSIDTPEGGDYAVLENNQIIGEAFARSSETTTHDARKNAILFAASKDLLAALQALTDRIGAFNQQTCCAPEFERARAAIAKAGG